MIKNPSLSESLNCLAAYHSQYFIRSGCRFCALPGNFKIRRCYYTEIPFFFNFLQCPFFIILPDSVLCWKLMSYVQRHHDKLQWRFKYHWNLSDTQLNDDLCNFGSFVQPCNEHCPPKPVSKTVDRNGNFSLMRVLEISLKLNRIKIICLPQ